MAGWRNAEAPSKCLGPSGTWPEFSSPCCLSYLSTSRGLRAETGSPSTWPDTPQRTCMDYLLLLQISGARQEREAGQKVLSSACLEGSREAGGMGSGWIWDKPVPFCPLRASLPSALQGKRLCWHGAAAGTGKQEGALAKASPGVLWVGVAGGPGLAAKALEMSMCRSLFGRRRWDFLHASHAHPMGWQPLAQARLQVWVC